VDFAFSEEQEAFRGEVRRFVEERWPAAEVRRLAETAEGFDPSVWKKMGEELGLPGVAIPETYGGQGFGFLELGIALEELGRQLAGGPFLSTTCLGAAAILEAGSEAQRRAWLPGLATGETIATLACCDARSPVAACRRDGTGWRVSGALPLVPDGRSAQLVLVPARESGAPGLSLLAVRSDVEGFAARPVAVLDLTRRFAEIELRDAPAELVGEPGAAGGAIARTLDRAAIGLAAEMVGAAARCLESAVAYAKQRVQFARPIGSFQAVKHKAAEVMLELECARSAAYWSWWVAAQPEVDPGALAEAASIAKSVCADALSRAAAENLQIHGGAGFTWELDCHLYYRRAKASELFLGDPTWHRARLADRLGF
jgi:alkylation response protein AidB-like acyl-CoA dehydrogenase